MARCEGNEAVTGNCPAASQVGHVMAAVGAGPAPLWVPQAGKRPANVYLGGPYKGAPTSIVAVVPKQAGPFDFGDEVVRSAVYVNPVTAQATVRSDPLPQQIEGIPIGYRDLHVAVDRPDFTLNPTGCEAKRIEATVASTEGALAHPSAPFAAVNCAKLGFKPRLALKLKGGTKRGKFPALSATFRPRPRRRQRLGHRRPPAPLAPSSNRATSARSAPGSNTTKAPGTAPTAPRAPPTATWWPRPR